MMWLNYVNVKQGSQTDKRFSRGNTLPLVQRPFGMASFVPQTDGDNTYWFYKPDHRGFEGYRMTHQPSPWIGDYGAFVINPQSEIPYVERYYRWSGFKPEDSIIMPHYMKHTLIRHRADFELTPTVSGACLRIDFKTDADTFISIVPAGGFISYEYNPETCLLTGYTTYYVGYDDSVNFKQFFVIRFPEGVVNAEKTLIEDDNAKIKKNGLKIEGENTGIHLALNKKCFEFNLSTSFISQEQAIINLERENIHNFDELKKINEDIWESYLGRVEIDAEEDKMKTFYSCLYRTMLFPHKNYELDKDNKPIHFCPADGTVKPGVRYTDNGFWDTYRTVYPLFSIIAPDELKEMLEGYIQDYRDMGWLPRWTAMSERNCMPSTLIDAVIADAAVKGIIDGDLLETAFEGMLKHANNDAPKPCYGRNGCSDYLKYGYVPTGEHHETVNLTLDASYGDFCIAQIAKIIGRNDIADEYMRRSKNYCNIFDKKTGFMRGKNADGKMEEPFDPLRWSDDYTEANAWVTTFAVQHDLDGLADLMGGKDEMEKKLDLLFSINPDYYVGSYKCEIHEMTEQAAADFGLCAISNQPSFHIPYIYAYIGCQQKTDYWVERLCSEAFSYKNDGYPGDEDNGTMAAWYVFSMLGLYPLCPGTANYVKGKMQVSSAKISGKKWDSSSFEKLIPHSALI